MKSEYFAKIQKVERGLTDEQVALMAVICEMNASPFGDKQVEDFAHKVGQAQSIMPSGTLHSRQALVILAMMAGM